MKESSTHPPRIAIAWKGLPAYGARLIRAAAEVAGEPITIIGTRARVPVEGIEGILGGSVIWLKDEQKYSWSDLGVPAPALFFQTSWATPAFNSLTIEAKRAGSKVVCFHDNRLKCNLRQLVGAIYYRAFLRRRYDAAWVPGSSCRKFCRLLGVPDGDIYEGVYSGWSEVFRPGPPLDERTCRMVFVGQTDQRKAVDILAQAWKGFAKDHPEWELHTYGQGPLEHLLKDIPRLFPHPFLQSHDIAAADREARFAIMASREDNWPLAIHEAASSGCGLLLSENIGNRHDLATTKNSVIFPPGDAKALEAAMRSAAGKSVEWLKEAGGESVRLAGEYGPHRFARAFLELRQRFLPTSA